MARDIWYIRGEGGGINRMAPPLGEGIAARLRAGSLVRVNEDGSTWNGDAPATGPDAAPLENPETTPNGTPTGVPAVRPTATADKADDAATAGRTPTADQIAAEREVEKDLPAGAVPVGAADAPRPAATIPAPATDAGPAVTPTPGAKSSPASLAEKRADDQLAEQAASTPTLPMPERSASKRAWVAYASSTGRITNDAADDLNRSELIERFGS